MRVQSLTRRCLPCAQVDSCGKVEADAFLKFAAPNELRENQHALEVRVTELAAARRRGRDGAGTSENSSPSRSPNSSPGKRVSRFNFGGGKGSNFTNSKALTGAKGAKRSVGDNEHLGMPPSPV